MMRSISYYWRRPSRHQILLLAAGVLFVTVRTTMAQADDVPADLRGRVPIIDPNGRVPPGTLPPGMVDEKGRPVAHVHNADMSCCAPCVPTEADESPDVFRRPCFVRKLAKSRVGFGAYHGLTGREDVKLAVEHLDPTDVEGFHSLLSKMLRPEYLPPAWDKIEIYGLTAFPLKTILEMRGGVETFVRQEPDRTAVVTELTEFDPVQAEWSVGVIDVLPQTFHGTRRLGMTVVRLRLPKDMRLEMRRRPSDVDFADPVAREKIQFFDKAALHKLLTEVFRVPFATVDDFVIEGYDAEYVGVAVFVGKILSPEWARARFGAKQPFGHWWDEMRVFVTDSDPQYFCVSIILGSDDPIPSPQP